MQILSTAVNHTLSLSSALRLIDWKIVYINCIKTYSLIIEISLKHLAFVYVTTTQANNKKKCTVTIIENL